MRFVICTCVLGSTLWDVYWNVIGWPILSATAAVMATILLAATQKRARRTTG